MSKGLQENRCQFQHKTENRLGTLDTPKLPPGKTLLYPTLPYPTWALRPSPHPPEDSAVCSSLDFHIELKQQKYKHIQNKKNQQKT